MPTTINLDDLIAIRQLDQSNVLGSVLALPDQCEDAYNQTQNLELPATYRDINNVLMTGMGGSGLGARIIESVYDEELKIPLKHLHDYHLPAWVDQKTLLIISAYSGTTEEPIQNAKTAIDKHLPWMAIAAGGQLIDLAKEHNVPYYQIETQNNPSNQPRMAVGYSLIGQLQFVAKAGLISLTKPEIDQCTQEMQAVIEKCGPDVPTTSNPAKLLATQLANKAIILVTYRHLCGAAHVVKNQLNENAKNFSVLFDIPELNHHLMEGLLHPQSNPDNLAFLLFTSSLVESRLNDRALITKEVIEKNGLTVHQWEVSGKTKLAQAFSLIQYGAFVVFYLSMLNGINPAPIPWVDYFKTRLGQSLGFHS